MKEWWVNLALREKQIIALGSALILIFIAYEFVFAALSDANQNLRTSIQKNQSMLAWMNATDKRIQSAANNHHEHVAVTSASLLSALQDDLNQNPISKNVTELQQSDNDSVEVHFKSVGFDNMMRWLLEAGQKLQLTVTAMSVTPTDSAGQVDSVLKFAAK